MLAPSEFMPVAEQSGLIVPIGAWVFEAACRQLGEWRRRDGLPDDVSIAINLSPAQLAAAPLVETIRDALSHAHLPAPSLCVEVAERTVAAQPGLAIDALGDVRALGAKVALDDFGIGSSSLAALGSYPVDRIKIDRSFVGAIDTAEQGSRIFAAILGIAHAFELPAVAEGIETPDQLRQVAEVGCEAGQGFLFARPAEAEEVVPRLSGSIASTTG
jgi:EAL domain-containing protein (putative c-di-GMP-specific phosphodiesterase class I)